jgi:hypothetical protein
MFVIVLFIASFPSVSYCNHGGRDHSSSVLNEETTAEWCDANGASKCTTDIKIERVLTSVSQTDRQIDWT